MTKIVDLSGKKFNRWTVVAFAYRKVVGKYAYQMFHCVCDCGTKRIVESTSLKKGNSISCGCYRLENQPRGKDCYQWKNKNLSYWGIHQWLRKNYGSAGICESKLVGALCDGKSKSFNWCKLKRVPYERKRENFIRMCRGCHNRYDMTDVTRDKISKTMQKIKAKK